MSRPTKRAISLGKTSSTDDDRETKVSVPKGSVSKGSVPKGSVPKGSVPKGSVPKGSVPKVSVPKVSVPKGSVPKGSVPKGSVQKVSVPKGSVPKGTSVRKISLEADERTETKEITETSERSEMSERSETSERVFKRPARVVKSATVLPKITLENLWENVSKRPPFNPIKADFMIRYLTENKVITEENQNDLIELLVRMMSDLPISEFISENQNVILNKLSDIEIEQMKILLLELRTAVNNFEDVNLIRGIVSNFPITVLTDGQLEQIQTLKYRDSNNKIIDLGNRSLIHEIFSLLLMIGFENTYEFLQGVTNPDDILFNSPTMKESRDKAIIDLNIIRWKPKIVSGNIKCRKCGKDKVNIIELQIRSADEPMTQFITCVSCNNRWKIG